METKGNYLVLRRLAKQRQKKILSVLIAIAVIVAIVVFWWLKLTGITMTGEALCDYTEHTHSDTCYQYTLICTDESEEHIHTADCTEKVLACTAEEHIHTADCYTPILDEEETSENEEYDAPPLMAVGDDGGSNITYINELTPAVKDVTIKTLDNVEISSGGTVYIGQEYVVSVRFAEDNQGDEWMQFQHDGDHRLHYQIPGNLQCEPFDWHPIYAETENGTIEDVGKYKVEEGGLLVVVFEDDENGECFGSRYTNVNFTIDFNAKVASTQSGSSTDVVFNDEIKVNLNIDSTAEMKVTKTHGTYNGKENTLDYQIRIEATKAVIKDLVVPDDIWERHYALKDTIVVTDLQGNILDPQPVVSDSTTGATGGFKLTGFPDFAAGEGFLINYKASINDDLLGQDEVGLWNGVYPYGKDAMGNEVKGEAQDWAVVQLNKIVKDGKQTFITEADGTVVPVIEWEVEIRKSDVNLEGTVLIDTLGHGLQYYTGQDILIKTYDQWGNKMPDKSISWDDVTINDNSMSFALPEGYRFVIVYYTTFEDLADDEQKHYTNTAKVTINNREEVAGGEADVVGFIPHIRKSASGDDGEYVYFKIEADVPGVIKNWGSFFLTDLSAFWSYKDGALYVENVPEDMVITATTESGQVINFTPYVEGGPTDNTYILVTPAQGNQYHSFNVFFNTSIADKDLSTWKLGEDSKLTISYKIPFDAKTGFEWTGKLTGDKTVEDVLLEEYKLANEAYLNYTDIITATAATSYNYSPKITKKSTVNEDGTVDYTVTFYNTIPGTLSSAEGVQGYLSSAQAIIFNDTFDEKLQYVKDSLYVTCYNPWSDSSWYNKYQYKGSVTGNTINVRAEAFERAETNYDYNDNVISWLEGMPTYQYYCNSIAGGRHVFTYKLKLKDEYLNTTEENKYILDNTAELKWDGDNTSGPVSDTVEFKTGLLDKHVVQENNKLNFDIHINRNALDILPGSNTITIEDTMTHNLSVYWDTIKLLYEESPGNWVNFDSENSRYDYTVTYDQTNNMLTFVLPDQLHIRIDYTTLITESGLVSVNNAVKVEGKAQVSDVIDAKFQVQDHSGGASGSLHSITLMKEDGETFERLPDVTFHLYGPVVDDNITAPDGVASSVLSHKGKELDYIATYTTGEDGTVKIENKYLTVGGPYALVEQEAPDGYMVLTKPVYFYFYDNGNDETIQTVTTLIAIENFTFGEILPETGSVGTLPFTICGVSLMALPLLYCIRTRRKERRKKAATL